MAYKKSIESIFPEVKWPRKSVHFIGIGGIGMSALARWFTLSLSKGLLPKKSRKQPVSGSDLAKSVITQSLLKEGLKAKIGHKKGHISTRIGLVIHSKAIKSTNPEMAAARRLNIPSLTYAEAVGRLTEAYKTIAVAGAHGKSTTSSLISLVLKKSRFDPTVVIGTNLKEFGNKNFRSGKSEYLVLEADEFGRSFLHYSPTLAVITNIDLEHLDTYKNLSEIKKAFLKFISNVKDGGVLVLNKDSAHLFSLKNKISRISRQKKLKVFWYSIKQPAAKKIKKSLKVPGEHNLSNALAAYTIGRNLKISEKKILSAIAGYRGSWRRMEYRGKCYVSRVLCNIYDDYAHHPTEIKAALKAFKEKYPRSPIVCVYQPHQALRLKKLFKDFVGAFGDADSLILLPIYQVAGRDKVSPRFTSKKLAEAMKKKYPKKDVHYLASPKKIKILLKKIMRNDLVSQRQSAYSPRKSALVVMMGAGDIVNYTDSLLNSS